MRIKYPNLVRLMVVLAMVCGLVAVVAAPASAISGIIAQNTPEAAGSAAKWAIDFSVDCEGFYQAGIDTFTITFPPEVTMPTTAGISKTAITMKVFNDGAQTGNPPLDADVDGHKVTITVPAVGFGGDPFPDIENGNEVIITISSSGGIKNPVTVKTGWELTVAGAYTIGEEEPAIATFDTIPPEAKVTLTPAYGPRNTSLKVSGTGFTPSYVATIYVVNDMSDHVVLGYADISSTGTFSASFTVTKPPFDKGENSIEVIDGGARADMEDFDLKAGITLSPATGRPGDLIHIIGSDTMGYVGDLAPPVLIGVDPVAQVPDGPWEGAQKQLNVIIPGGLAPGKVKVMLWDENGPGPESAEFPGNYLVTADLLISGQPVTVTPAIGGVGTKVIISGTGFTPGEEAIDKIELGGIDWVGPVAVTSNGTFTAQAVVTEELWDDLGPGNWSVYVEDDDGRIGISQYTIPKPTLTISPEESGIGSTVIAKGTGFSVTAMFGIFYDAEGVDCPEAPALLGTTSSAGTFTAGIKVPNCAAPGQKYYVEALVWHGVDREEFARVEHKVATGVVETTPTSANIGKAITVKLTGFQPYAKVEWAHLDQKSILPTIDQWTNGKGAVTFNTMVPGAAQEGPTVVMVNVGGVVSSTAFTVLEAPVTVADALESIVDKVVIVWGLVDGEWLFWDPNDIPGSTLQDLESGTGYFVKVSEDCTLVYGAFNKDLKAAYWNNVGWP